MHILIAGIVCSFFFVTQSQTMDQQQVRSLYHIRCENSEGVVTKCFGQQQKDSSYYHVAFKDEHNVVTEKVLFDKDLLSCSTTLQDLAHQFSDCGTKDIPFTMFKRDIDPSYFCEALNFTARAKSMQFRMGEQAANEAMQHDLPKDYRYVTTLLKAANYLQIPQQRLAVLIEFINKPVKAWHSTLNEAIKADLPSLDTLDPDLALACKQKIIARIQEALEPKIVAKALVSDKISRSKIPPTLEVVQWPRNSVEFCIEHHHDKKRSSLFKRFTEQGKEKEDLTDPLFEALKQLQTKQVTWFGDNIPPASYDATIADNIWLHAFHNGTFGISFSSDYNCFCISLAPSTNSLCKNNKPALTTGGTGKSYCTSGISWIYYYGTLLTIPGLCSHIEPFKDADNNVQIACLAKKNIPFNPITSFIIKHINPVSKCSTDIKELEASFDYIVTVSTSGTGSKLICSKQNAHNSSFCTQFYILDFQTGKMIDIKGLDYNSSYNYKHRFFVFPRDESMITINYAVGGALYKWILNIKTDEIMDMEKKELPEESLLISESKTTTYSEDLPSQWLSIKPSVGNVGNKYLINTPGALYVTTTKTDHPLALSPVKRFDKTILKTILQKITTLSLPLLFEQLHALEYIVNGESDHTVQKIFAQMPRDTQDFFNQLQKKSKKRTRTETEMASSTATKKRKIDGANNSES